MKILQVVPLLCLLLDSSDALAAKGSAAKPFEKKKVAVLGGGGYIGALAFGYLQRCTSIYPTGIGSCRTIGACADTSIRMNRVLGNNFCLAVADETFIKLTDLSSAQAIQQQLKGWDALLLGDQFNIRQRAVTANTYEKTPNDKTFEIYWEDADVDSEETEIGQSILTNTLDAASSAGVKHIFAIGTKPFLFEKLSKSSIPFTCLCPTGPVERRPGFTFRSGVQSSLVVELIPKAEIQNLDASSNPIYLEDLAALAIQCVQNLDWKSSRFLKVSNQGESPSFKSSKRPDQQFIVNSELLEECLAGCE